jgi:O-antigen/teichoic acid export membrane protein
MFRDFGVGSYLKQAKELTPQVIRSAFGLLLVTSWTVAAVIYSSASLWGEFFNDARVAEVVRILALGFIFIPFGTVPEAILTREYAVTQLAKAAVFTISIYFIVSVILALSGFSYKTMACSSDSLDASVLRMGENSSLRIWEYSDLSFEGCGQFLARHGIG